MGRDTKRVTVFRVVLLRGFRNRFLLDNVFEQKWLQLIQNKESASILLDNFSGGVRWQFLRFFRSQR